MLIVGWFEEATRGSNWKFKFDCRAKLRIASVKGTSSMTIRGTVSLVPAVPAEGAAAAVVVAFWPAAASAGAAVGAAAGAGPASGVAAGAGVAGVVGVAGVAAGSGAGVGAAGATAGSGATVGAAGAATGSGNGVAAGAGACAGVACSTGPEGAGFGTASGAALVMSFATPARQVARRRMTDVVFIFIGDLKFVWGGSLTRS